MANLQKITPFLWFDSDAEEAVNLYVSLFQNSKIGDITHYRRTGKGRGAISLLYVFEITLPQVHPVNRTHNDRRMNWWLSPLCDAIMVADIPLGWRRDWLTHHYQRPARPVG